MNEPIVSPWLIYLVGRLDIIHGFCCIVGFFLTVIAFLAGIIKFVDDDYYSDAANKRFWSSFKKLVCVTLIFNALASFIPTRDEAIAMYVAGRITPANIKAAGEFTDKSVDKLIEKILKANKAIKE